MKIAFRLYSVRVRDIDAMMKHALKFLVLVVLLSMPWTAGVQHAYAQSCLGPGQARAAISNGQAAPLSKVSKRVQARTGGDVINARLCRGRGGLVYILTILQRNGQTAQIVANARSGAIIR